MYIPDLFGAYTKGRELAIEKNWQDLKNYEQIENARNVNDLQALDLLGKRADFGGNRSMFQNQVDSSGRANEVAEHAQAGMVSRADLGSLFAQDQRSTYINNRDQAQQGMHDTFNAQVNKMINTALAQRGANEFFHPRAYEMGANQGNLAYQTSLANNVQAANLVNAAQQAVNLSNQNYGNNHAAGQLQGLQTGYAIQNAPLQQANTVDALGRVVPARNAMQQQIDNAHNTELSNAQIGALISLASAGDQGAIWQLAQMGLNPQGRPLQPVPVSQTTPLLPTSIVAHPTPPLAAQPTSLIPTPAQQVVQQTQRVGQVANALGQVIKAKPTIDVPIDNLSGMPVFIPRY